MKPALAAVAALMIAVSPLNAQTNQPAGSPPHSAEEANQPAGLPSHAEQETSRPAELQPRSAEESTQMSEPPIRFVDRQDPEDMLGTDFIGTLVTTGKGQRLGRISNLVFDKEGRIELAVIRLGEFFRIARKQVAVPFDNVRFETINDKNVFVIDATKEDLNAAPAFETLNDKAFKERMSNLREKAKKRWSEIRGRASKAYEEAKERVGEESERLKQRVEEFRQPKPAQ